MAANITLSQLTTALQGMALQNDARFLKQTDAGSLATKDSVSTSDLDSNLSALISGKADASDVYTKDQIDSKVGSVFKLKGTVNASELTSSLLTAENVGSVFNISDNFTTTNDFLEGSGKQLYAGTNVAIVEATPADNSDPDNPIPATYKFDSLAGLVDVSGVVSYSDATPSVNGTGGASGLMSATDKEKLDGIDDNANYYIHPSYTSITANVANATPGFGSTFTTSEVTTDSLGHVTSVSNRNVQIPNALATASTNGTGGSAGLMSASDKEKVDGITSASDADIQNLLNNLYDI